MFLLNSVHCRMACTNYSNSIDMKTQTAVKASITLNNQQQFVFRKIKKTYKLSVFLIAKANISTLDVLGKHRFNTIQNTLFLCVVVHYIQHMFMYKFSVPVSY